MRNHSLFDVSTAIMYNPYGSPLANHTTKWEAEPQFRGTYGILSTCLLTIGLSVWTALHLNLPEYGTATAWRQFRRKFSWLMVGLFAPELVVWTAFEQNKLARRIHRAMRCVLGQAPPPTFKQQLVQFVTPWKKRDPSAALDVGSENQVPVKHRSNSGFITLLDKSHSSQLDKTGAQHRHPWTMTHSHYVAMGGFALYSDTHGSMLRSVDERLERPFVLDLAFLTLLADIDIDYIPNISEAQINDKSKASGLAKLLVCVQAIWFCIQCLSRLAQGLPICLLELNTLAHAICALLVYLLWWKKPLDIEEPNLIEKEKAQDIFGMAYVQEQMRKPLVLLPSGRDQGDGDHEPAQGIFVRAGDTSYKWQSLNTGLYNPRINLQHKCQTRPRSLQNNESARAARDQEHQRILSPGDHRLYVGESLHGYSISSWSFSVPGEEKFRVLSSTPDDMFPSVDLKPEQVQRLKRANEAFELVDRLREKQKLTSTAQRELFDLFSKRYSRASNRLRIVPGSSAFSESSFQLSAIVAGLVYGAIHLTAWNAPFANDTQRTLWRTSGLLLAVASPIFLSLFLVWCWVMDNLLVNRKLLKGIVGTLGGLVLVPLVAAYVFARFYLVVECFVSFGHLPADVYQVPQWSQYFPHIA